MLRLLIHGPQLGAGDIIEDPVLKRAIDKQRDPEFLQCLREEIQQGLDRAFDSLSHGHSGDAEVQQLFIEHVLNFIPIITPGDMQTLRVPQWITDRWLQVEYRIEPIELTVKLLMWVIKSTRLVWCHNMPVPEKSILVKVSVGCIKNSCCGKKAIESAEAPVPSMSMA